jgi:hypothetical protein
VSASHQRAGGLRRRREQTTSRDIFSSRRGAKEGTRPGIGRAQPSRSPTSKDMKKTPKLRMVSIVTGSRTDNVYKSLARRIWISAHAATTCWPRIRGAERRGRSHAPRLLRPLQSVRAICCCCCRMWGASVRGMGRTVRGDRVGVGRAARVREEPNACIDALDAVLLV